MNRSLLRLLASLALLLPVLLHAQDRKAVTHEDIWLLPRVGAPAVSPDGRHAVFCVIEPSYNTDQQTSDIWLVATDGKTPPRRLTQTRTPESGQTWSPDSRRIAFSTKREGDEVNQIYVLDLAPAAKRNAPHSSALAHACLNLSGWQADRLHQRCPAEAATKKTGKRGSPTKEGAQIQNARLHDFPIRNWDVAAGESPPARLRAKIRSERMRGTCSPAELVKQPGFDGRSTKAAASWITCGRRTARALVFSATRNANRGAYDYTNAELWQVELRGGEPRRLTGAEDLKGGDSWSEPRFSPDGRSLYAL